MHAHADVTTHTVQIYPSDYLLKLQLTEEIRNVILKHGVSRERPNDDIIVNTVAAYVNAWRSSGDAGGARQELLMDTLCLERSELGHAWRVASLSCLISDVAGIDARGVEAIELAALLHDIGKMWIPRNILMKPAVLSELEWNVMKLHSELGWHLLNRAGNVEQEAAIIHSHHERFDGGGYPQGLSKERIPIGARVLAIADAVDAMMSDRAYRRGRTVAIAREEISRLSGAQFDPQFVRCLDSIPDESITALWRGFEVFAT
jgi:HD-GYP domain-containing protein (c-di-GMP phosphodiesterase class II)